MTSAFSLTDIAREVKAAQDNAQQFQPLTTRYPGLDVPAAYAVANLIHEMRLAEGAVPVGRKIGFTNPDMWARYGVQEPIWAYVYDTTVARLKAGHGQCRLNRFTEPKIEPEIIFHFHASPPVDAGLEAILASIDWVAHGFEIVQSHCPGWQFKAADTIADWALHGTLLIGEPQPVSRFDTDLIATLETFAINLCCNNAVREVGRGSNVLGSPLAAIAHLIAVLATQPQYQPLQADEIVTTGTITTAQAVNAGETWGTTLSGINLPGVTVEFT